MQAFLTVELMDLFLYSLRTSYSQHMASSEWSVCSRIYQLRLHSDFEFDGGFAMACNNDSLCNLWCCQLTAARLLSLFLRQALNMIVCHGLTDLSFDLVTSFSNYVVFPHGSKYPTRMDPG